MTVHRATTDYPADVANAHLGGWFLLKVNLFCMYFKPILCNKIDLMLNHIISSRNKTSLYRHRPEAVYFHGCLWILFYFTIANY